jgi:glycosyltransferase involved in cell wall biosynthesis
MRILHVISSLDPACGGPSAVAASLASAQAKLGHQVVLATVEQPERRELISRTVERMPGSAAVYVHWLKQEWLRPLKFLQLGLSQSATESLSDLVGEADIVHLHGVWDVLIYGAAKECRRLNRPYCLVLHGMLDPWQLQQKYWKKRLALILGYRKMLDRAAFLHVLNEDEGRLIGPLKLAAPRAIIPNGIFSEEIATLPSRGHFCARYPRLRERPFVLFLGRLHFKKGLDYLADAFNIVARQCPDVQLVVAGPDGGERGPFERRIAQVGLKDRVHVVGPIYGPDKFAALVDCACFCLPSRQEGFSMAIIEALACGVPVVISEACHFPEVAKIGAGEIVPLDAHALGEALVRVLSDAEQRKRMGQTGMDLVRSRYTWVNIAQQAIDAYHRFGNAKVMSRQQHCEH